MHISAGSEGAPGSLLIESRAEEMGDNKGEIDAKVEGEGGKIAFNSRYLTEVLSVLDTKEVALETTTPSSPGVLRPVVGSIDATVGATSEAPSEHGGESYVHVVMPMFVQW